MEMPQSHPAVGELLGAGEETMPQRDKLNRWKIEAERLSGLPNVTQLVNEGQY